MNAVLGRLVLPSKAAVVAAALPETCEMKFYYFNVYDFFEQIGYWNSDYIDFSIRLLLLFKNRGETSAVAY